MPRAALVPRLPIRREQPNRWKQKTAAHIRLAPIELLVDDNLVLRAKAPVECSAREADGPGAGTDEDNANVELSPSDAIVDERDKVSRLW